MKIIALYSNKGGVGKTAGAVNLAHLAAEDGNRTLLIDLDPQGSASYYFRVKNKLKNSALGFKGSARKISRNIKESDYFGLDILPADFSHRSLDQALAGDVKRKGFTPLTKAFANEYDLLFFDAPPTINVLAEEILEISDRILVPMIPTTLSARTFFQLMSFLMQSEQDVSKISAYFSMVDRRKTMHRAQMERMRKLLDSILKTDIGYLSMIEQMGEYREPITAYMPKSRGAKQFSALWEEIKALL